jgi:multidrug efflux pump subunit AcrA (membrane-fusion protein)
VSTALTLYERLTEAGEDGARARIFADAFNALEERLPALDTLATRTQLSETELALTREIEQVRKEIEQVRKEVKELDGRLTKEIKELDGRLTKEIKEMEIRLVTAMGELKVSTIRWVVGLLLGQTGILVAALLGGMRLFASSGP